LHLVGSAILLYLIDDARSNKNQLYVYLDSLLAVEKVFVMNFTPDKTAFDLHRQITSAVDNCLPVTTWWGVLSLWLEERPTDMEGSREYIE